MPILLYLEAVFSWGFSVRAPGTSGGGPSLPLPPPSTLLGAVAHGVARAMGWREVEGGSSPVAKLAPYLLAAAAGIVEGFSIPYVDLMRYLAVPFIRRENVKKPAMWFGALGFGAVSAAGTLIAAAVVLSDRVLGVAPLEVLRAATGSVARLGSREGVVHVVRSWVGRVDEVRGGETLLYAPVDAVAEPPATRLELTVWDPRDPEAYSAPRGRRPRQPRTLRIVAPAALTVAGGVIGARGETPAMELRRDYPSYPLPPGASLSGVVAALPG